MRERKREGERSMSVSGWVSTYR